jgi:hypothetical protein
VPDETETSWPAGKAVRLVNDPGKEGILTGRTMTRAGTRYYEVSFHGLGRSWQPDYELEPIEEPEDWYQLLERGRFGRVGDLRRGMTHITLSGRLANMLYSMRTTNTSFLAYQYKPVLAMLDSPCNGLLVADEVGLGKTIEAGLVWTEMRARFDARRLLIVCPAMLRAKWKNELSSRFGVQADVADARELLDELHKPKEQTRDGKALVCSLQGTRPPRGWKEDDETQSARVLLARWLADQADQDPLVDMLVIDEAHYLRNSETQMHELGQLLGSVSEYVLLLSATPINLHNEDLQNLLKIVDPDSFQTPWYFDQVLEANRPLILARRKILQPGSSVEEIRQHLLEAKGHSMLQLSQVLADVCENPPSAEELADPATRVRLADAVERINPLGRIVSRTRKVEVEEQRIIRRPYTEPVQMTAHETEFYRLVTEAIRHYAFQRGISDGFLLAMPQRMVASCMAAASLSLTDCQPSEEDLEELQFDAFGDPIESRQASNDWHGSDFHDVGPLIGHIRARLRGRINTDALTRDDSKYHRLISVLRDNFTAHPEEKVVLFSYFKGTLSYLEERLTQGGIMSIRLVGGFNADKQAIIDGFRDDPQVRILLSSEVAAEGVDLQFCKLLINYDLPWNPMRVEQRIGRIDRIGQSAKVIHIWNLFHTRTIDERIIKRLYERLRIFEQALGGLEAVLGEEIAKLTADLLSRNLTAEEEDRLIDQRTLAIEARRNEEERLEQEAAGLIAHGGVILESIKRADQMNRRVTEQDLFAYVRDYLEGHAPGHNFRQVSDEPLECMIRLPANIAAALQDFIQRRRVEGGSKLGHGMEVRCRFQNVVAVREYEVEIISQLHPLIRFINEELSLSRQGSYPLIAARLTLDATSTALAAGDYAFCMSLWAFEGMKTEEELHVRAIHVQNGQEVLPSEAFDLVNALRSQGTDWPEANAELNSSQLRELLEGAAMLDQNDFDAARRLKKKENHDRVAFQIASMTRHLERKRNMHGENAHRHQLAGRKGLALAERKKIELLEQRFHTQRERLESKGRPSSNRFEQFFGVIRLVTA